MNSITVTNISVEELERLLENKLESVLKNWSEHFQYDPQERLTRRELSQLFKVSYPTIHAAMNRGDLPFEKVGRKTLFKRSDAELFFKKY